MWFRWKPPPQPPRKPEIGDLIEIKRKHYQHWAVYVGLGYVIHIVRLGYDGGHSSSSMSGDGDKAILKKEKLVEVVGTDKWRVHNRLDDQYDPRSPEEIVETAESMLDQELNYNVVKKNCEHFATSMRYGTPKSMQVLHAAGQTLLMVAYSPLVPVNLLILVVPLLAFMLGTKKKKNVVVVYEYADASVLEEWAAELGEEEEAE